MELCSTSYNAFIPSCCYRRWWVTAGVTKTTAVTRAAAVTREAAVTAFTHAAAVTAVTRLEAVTDVTRSAAVIHSSAVASGTRAAAVTNHICFSTALLEGTRIVICTAAVHSSVLQLSQMAVTAVVN